MCVCMGVGGAWRRAACLQSCAFPPVLQPTPHGPIRLALGRLESPFPLTPVPRTFHPRLNHSVPPSLPPSLPFLPLFRSPHTPTADFTITPGYLLNLTKNGLNPLQAFRDAMNTKGTEGRDGGREGRRKGGRG